MTGNTLRYLSSPVADHNAANKAYVDENAGIWKSGDVIMEI